MFTNKSNHGPEYQMFGHIIEESDEAFQTDVDTLSQLESASKYAGWMESGEAKCSDLVDSHYPVLVQGVVRYQAVPELRVRQGSHLIAD